MKKKWEFEPLCCVAVAFKHASPSRSGEPVELMIFICHLTFQGSLNAPILIRVQDVATAESCSRETPVAFGGVLLY